MLIRASTDLTPSARFGIVADCLPLTSEAAISSAYRYFGASMSIESFTASTCAAVDPSILADTQTAPPTAFGRVGGRGPDHRCRGDRLASDGSSEHHLRKRGLRSEPDMPRLRRDLGGTTIELVDRQTADRMGGDCRL